MDWLIKLWNSWFRKKQKHWQILSISNPTMYNEDDILRMADSGIEVHNWTTINGGRMTPYQKEDYSYTNEQINFFKKLYAKGVRTFWIGISESHLELLGEDDIRIAIRKCINDLLISMPENICAGIYLPSWQDEILTRKRPGLTPQKQFIYVKNAHDKLIEELKKDLVPEQMARVKYLITGHWKNTQYDVDISNWECAVFANHTFITSKSDVINYIYDDVFERIIDWEFPRFAWTDSGLVNGITGSRRLTEDGKKYFRI